MLAWKEILIYDLWDLWIVREQNKIPVLAERHPDGPIRGSSRCRARLRRYAAGSCSVRPTSESPASCKMDIQAGRAALVGFKNTAELWECTLWGAKYKNLPKSFKEASYSVKCVYSIMRSSPWLQNMNDLWDSSLSPWVHSTCGQQTSKSISGSVFQEGSGSLWEAENNQV